MLSKFSNTSFPTVPADPDKCIAGKNLNICALGVYRSHGVFTEDWEECSCNVMYLEIKLWFYITCYYS